MDTHELFPTHASLRKFSKQSNGDVILTQSKQTLVATSSTHAEMRALYSLIIEVIYVIQLCAELRRPIALPAIIFEDNQPVIDLTADISSRSKKCKHFLMLISYVKEQVEAGLVILEKVPTAKNTADILTKIVVGSEYRQKALDLLGSSIFPSYNTTQDYEQSSSA